MSESEVRGWPEIRLAAIRAIVEAADDFGHDNLVMGDAEKLADAVLGVVDEEALNRMTAEFADETRLRAMDFRNGATMDLEPSRTLVAHWVAAARAVLGDAVNYVTMEIKLAGEAERYEFVLQRAGKLTPHEARKKAEAERDEALAELERLKAAMQNA